MKELIYFFVILTLFILFFFFSVLHESIYISIFFLISLFLLSSFLFLMSGLEFVGFLYLIVYVGAVAVLFLFMVMLFDRTEYVIFDRQNVDKTVFISNILMIISFSFTVLLAFDFVFFNSGNFVLQDKIQGFFNIFFENRVSLILSLSDSYSSIEAIGILLYDYFFIALLGASLVLLLGMVGAIVLTQNVNLFGQFYKHQEIKEQLIRRSRK